MATKQNQNKAAAEKAAAEKAAAEKAAAEKAAAEKAAAEKAAAEKAAGTANKGNTVMVPALSVVSSREGFRRGGRSWSKGETIVKLSELGTEQIALIKGESLLTVTEVEIEEQAVE